ncbi:hypothetical protein L5515_018805 [Caenorhabditis briggsae]|uniref:Uncharacterized protein n=1 Tax=Caenorhabditis briggsae TaxID=6238 RepID=A0AAE9FHS7_CAEBR|nr:hypothetical protein L5515_018805 [Caenorhabditis briggsae]
MPDSEFQSPEFIVLKQQRKSDVSDMKEKKALEDQINQLEERKNVPLNVFFTLLPHLWVIDLHGFLIGGAVRYVNKIAEEMMEIAQSKRKMMMDLLIEMNADAQEKLMIDGDEESVTESYENSQT